MQHLRTQKWVAVVINLCLHLAVMTNCEKLKRVQCWDVFLWHTVHIGLIKLGHLIHESKVGKKT